METNNPVRICIPICERTLDALEHSAAKASAEGDAIELRLDCLLPLESDRYVELDELAGRIGLPTILTFRPAEQGGKRALDYEARYAFWCREQAATGSHFMDVEVDVVEGLTASQSPPAPPIDWTRIIASHHDFKGLPAELEQIYQRMAHTPARILKLAVQAGDVTDCIPIFRLLDRARAENREMIAIAMGPAGIATRILGPSRGAFLTYGALEADSATAPGQISAGELRHLYCIRRITRQTQILGLAGLPVGHSISPHLHNAAFEHEGFDGVYIPFEVGDIASFIKRMVHPRSREIDWNLRGLSVTAPHKGAVMNYLDWIDPAAREIGAANTIVVRGEELHGYNTDAIAFIDTLVQKAGELRAARCAVIGAGGAASAALWGLRQKRAQVTVYARDGEKARLLAEKFGAKWERLGAAPLREFDVVINASTLGTWGKQETETPLVADQLRGARLAYDLVYNPEETRFLREARAAGCGVLGGLAMLVTQATEQFRLWTGVKAPEEVMQNAAIKALKAAHGLNRSN
jgi:3-dehydroquinate dehydratase/shikimate dehydrogenase